METTSASFPLPIVSLCVHWLLCKRDTFNSIILLAIYRVLQLHNHKEVKYVFWWKNCVHIISELVVISLYSIHHSISRIITLHRTPFRRSSGAPLELPSRFTLFVSVCAPCLFCNIFLLRINWDIHIKEEKKIMEPIFVCSFSQPNAWSDVRAEVIKKSEDMKASIWDAHYHGDGGRLS